MIKLICIIPSKDVDNKPPTSVIISTKELFYHLQKFFHAFKLMNI